MMLRTILFANFSSANSYNAFINVSASYLLTTYFAVGIDESFWSILISKGALKRYENPLFGSSNWGDETPKSKKIKSKSWIFCSFNNSGTSAKLESIVLKFVPILLNLSSENVKASLSWSTPYKNPSGILFKNSELCPALPKVISKTLEFFFKLAYSITSSSITETWWL